MTIKEINEKRLALNKEVRTILDNEKATPEDKVKADGLLTEMNSLSVDIERIKKSDEQDAELRKIDFKPEAATGDKKEDKPEQRTEKQTEELENRAFYKYCMKGRAGLTAEENSVIKTETRAAESTNAGTGGDLIPGAFMRNLEVAMKYYASFTEWADVIDTADGAPMVWPISSTVNRLAQLVPEGSAVTDAAIATDKVIFGAYKFGDLVKVGMEISQDAFTSVDGLVTDAFAESFGRALSSYFTTGTGVNQPTGILTAATAGPTVTGDDNQTSPNPLVEVGYFDMLALYHSVDPAYRNLPGAKWMFSDSTLLAVQRLKDKFGRPLWQPSFTSEEPNVILNVPYIINNFMDNLGASKKAVLYGDLSRYKVRRVKTMTIQRLVERYAEFGQVGLIAWARYDGDLLDAGGHPVKYLIQPAS
jgi:HK97 family phage major capsid protein